MHEAIESIMRNGISGEEGSWSFPIPDISDIRRRLNVLFSMDHLSREDIFKDTYFKGICACGDEYGARYYAQRHNRIEEKKESILITFTVDIERVYIDGRDFLYTAFQLWNRTTTKNIKTQKSCLRKLFGANIERYFERCVISNDQSLRIIMADLATFDKKVVLSHWKNTKVIGGRYGTRFCSAFFVQAPISVSEIDSCVVIDSHFSEKDVFIDLNSFLGRGR